MAYTREQLAVFVDAGSSVLVGGVSYTTSASLPSQETLDAINGVVSIRPADTFFGLPTNATAAPAEGQTIQFNATTDKWEFVAGTTGGITAFTQTGTGATSAVTLTSASATAFNVGANGATNPVFQLNANTASVATGLKITGAAAGSGVALAAISSGSNESLQLSPKGTGIVLVGETAAVAATGGAATSNTQRGVVTSESITTAAGADYTLTLTNSKVTATSVIQATADNGTNTTEGLAINRVTPGSGSAVIKVRNTHASAALNGTIKVSYIIL